ncbi:MAG: hypothetical protein JST85_28840 [Acidobacteria bacterium]|nr:hypothetical protein [Acidobacteriota bacterium]
MKRLSTQLRVWMLGATLVFGFPAVSGGLAQAQTRSRSQSAQTTTAYNRGYADGYNDGYREGRSDYTQNAERDHKRSQLYQEADRGYEARLGSLAEYREGYRLGFELGYTDSFYGRSINRQAPRNARSMTLRQRDRDHARTSSVIPADTPLRLRLVTPLSTKNNSEGDRFNARVVEPAIYEGATVEGHIARIERSGKLTGHTEMALDFDTITLRDGRRSPFYAQIEKFYIGDSIKTTDEEGNIDSANKTRDILIRSGGGAALGAIIGAIAKGGKGAAIGAIIGAGVGAGSVFIQGNKELILDAGTEMSVRTTAGTGAIARSGT